MSEVVSKELYLRVIASRPFKLDATETDYRDSEGKEKCQSCSHFFTRKIDGWAVCELLRDVKENKKGETDEDPINPEYVCDFWNEDGETFPLLGE
jgi:hypothetical protein